MLSSKTSNYSKIFELIDKNHYNSKKIMKIFFLTRNKSMNFEFFYNNFIKCNNIKLEEW